MNVDRDGLKAVAERAVLTVRHAKSLDQAVEYLVELFIQAAKAGEKAAYDDLLMRAP